MLKILCKLFGHNFKKDVFNVKHHPSYETNGLFYPGYTSWDFYLKCQRCGCNQFEKRQGLNEIKVNRRTK